MEHKVGKKFRGSGYLAFLPFFVIIFCYEILPLADLCVSSLIGKYSGRFGVENFVKILTTPVYQQAALNSLRISLISAVIGLIAAFFAAGCCWEETGTAGRIFTMLLNMMSNFSGVPLAFAFMVLMGNTGVLTLLGNRAGIPFLADFDLYSGQGLVMVYVYFQIPLATLLLLPAFSGIRREWKEAACLLKAGPLAYWTQIVIPSLLPAILGTLSVLFANALAAYATAYALVMNNYALLSLQITSKYKGDVQIDKATGGALAVLLIVLMLLAAGISSYFSSRSAKGRKLV